MVTFPYLFMFLIFSVNAENILVYTNGWIPVSNKIVYDQIKRENMQLPSEINYNERFYVNEDLATSNQHKTEKSFVNDSTQNIDDYKINCNTKDVHNCKIRNNTNKPLNEYRDQAKEVYKYQQSDLRVEPNLNQLINKTTRRSKKVATITLKDFTRNIPEIESKSLSRNNENTLYEVTEKTVDNIIHQDETKDIGFKYEPPTEKNVTGVGLFKILSKYKINKDDELPNYALSRRQKSLTPTKHNLISAPHNFLPPKTSIVYKSNSLNHLPVDPLLAVFLSNYGYYLQGMYGAQNRYNNLYGYLASNNIHNNRPFGIYKIFSDTDSSH